MRPARSPCWFLHAPAAAQRIENTVAVFAALDKVTAKISRLEVPLNQTAHVRRPQGDAAGVLHARAHRAAQDDDLRGGRRDQLDGKEKRIFSGWMFADSPGLNAVEHPVFDVWLTDCSQPRVAAQRPPQPGAPPGAVPPAAAPDPNDPDRPRRRVPR